MKSILQLLGKYRADVTIVAVYGILAIIFTLLIYMFVKKKSIKYLFNIALIVIGFVVLFMGYKNILKDNGLGQIKSSIKILTFSGVGFLFSIVLDLMDSIFTKSKKKDVKKEAEKREKEKAVFDEKDLKIASEKKGKDHKETKSFHAKGKRGDDGLTKVISNFNKEELKGEKIKPEKIKPLSKELEEDLKVSELGEEDGSEISFTEKSTQYWKKFTKKAQEVFKIIKIYLKKLAKSIGEFFNKIIDKIKSLFKTD